MKIIDHVYPSTLKAIVKDIMNQIADSESFVNDSSNEDDDYKQEVRDEIPKKVEMITPVLINIKRAFRFSFSEEMEEFVKKYNIEIPEEEEFLNKNNPVEEIRSCIEEAPLDFLGTGSNSRYAAKEEREWHARVEKALKEIEKHV